MARLTGRKSTNIDDRRGGKAKLAQRMVEFDESQQRIKQDREAFERAKAEGLKKEHYAWWWKRKNTERSRERELMGFGGTAPALPSGSPTGFWGGEIQDRRSANDRRFGFNPSLGEVPAIAKVEGPVTGGLGEIFAQMVTAARLEPSVNERSAVQQMPAQQRAQANGLPEQLALSPQTNFFEDALNVPQQQVPRELQMAPGGTSPQMILFMQRKLREEALRKALLAGAENPQFNIPQPGVR